MMAGLMNRRKTIEYLTSTLDNPRLSKTKKTELSKEKESRNIHKVLTVDDVLRDLTVSFPVLERLPDDKQRANGKY